MVVIAQVLLGEGYYAERSAKQAAEILKRRSEFITTKIDFLKNQIKDLEAEAAFARETAAEAAVRVLLPQLSSCAFFACYTISIQETSSLLTSQSSQRNNEVRKYVVRKFLDYAYQTTKLIGFL